MIFENDNTPAKTDRRNRLTSPPQYGYNFGKIPPQALDLEESVLGACLIEREGLQTVAEYLKPDIFYDIRHQKICKSIQLLQAAGSPVDILTVTAQLRATGELEMVGGAFYITELTNRVASAANIEYHIRIVIQKFVQRELIRHSAEIMTAAYEDTSDIFDLLSKGSVLSDNLLNSIARQKDVNNGDLFDARYADILAKAQTDTHVTGIASGFSDVDHCTGGWQKTDLIIIAARPAMGKTSFVLQCARNAAVDFGHKVAFFSLEMSKEQLMDKEISILTGVPLWKIKKNKLDAEDHSRIQSFRHEFHSANIHWDDTPALTLAEFRAKARRMKKQHDIELICIDYLQLMHGDAGKLANREQNVGFISRGLKAVAKELNIPIIALSQLSRAVETRPGGQKRPMLSDLRESGSIEQDADMVAFLYRDEYYGITQDANGMPTDGLAEFIIAKHRNGNTDDFVLKFDKETTGFSDDTMMPTFTGSVVAFNGDDLIDKPNNFIIRPNTDFDNISNIADEPPF